MQIEAVASQILEIDLAREQTIADAAQRFGDGPLDMLVNIAGKYIFIPESKPFLISSWP